MTTPQEILVVDDDQATRDSLARILHYNGYAVVTAEDGLDALAKLTSFHPEAVVMDVMMPNLDGLETTRRLRESGNEIPILILTARDSVGDRVDGLDAGADDYLVKPFAAEELLARLRALTRRTRSELAASTQVLSFDDLQADTLSREVFRGGEKITLTRTEYALVVAFLSNPRRVLDRQWLLDEIWGRDFPSKVNSLEVYIGYLRRKIEVGDRPRLIWTVRGVGYILNETAP
jgi:two-component system response regulator MprA